MNKRIVPVVVALVSFPLWYGLAPPPPGQVASPDPVVSLAAEGSTQEVSEVATRWRELQDRQTKLNAKLEEARQEMGKAQAVILNLAVPAPVVQPPGASNSPRNTPVTANAEPVKDVSKNSEEFRAKLDEKLKLGDKTQTFRDEGHLKASSMVDAYRFQSVPMVLQRGDHWQVTGETALKILSYQRGVTTKEKIAQF